MEKIISIEIPKPNEAFRREIYTRIGNQRIAARALKVSEGHLSSIINGWIPPGRELAERASVIFGKPVEALFPHLKI